ALFSAHLWPGQISCVKWFRGVSASLNRPGIGAEANLIFVQATSLAEASSLQLAEALGFSQQTLFGPLRLIPCLLSAVFARYFVRPPLQPTSRLTVETDRSINLTICRSESPADNPREISSRSDRERTRSDRVRFGGEIPP